MKLHKLFFTILILFLSIHNSFGQENEPPQTLDWIAQYGIYHEGVPLYSRFDRYNSDDLKNFREMLELFKNSKSNKEWEGYYSDDGPGEVGYEQLRLNFDVGFVEFYVYTCQPELRGINYGKIENSADVIQLSPQFAKNSPRKSEVQRYVKVKWGERYYLVEESSLSAFAEKAVGVYIEPDEMDDENYQKWSNYWVNGDFEKDLVGLPVFPNAYKKFQRLPIESKIISIGKRTIEKEISFGNAVYSNGALYPITINVGKNKGVKKGMFFEISETKDRLLITKANQNNAIGLIHRDIDDNKKDSCSDKNSNTIPCPKLKVSLKAKTPIGKFWWEYFNF